VAKKGLQASTGTGIEIANALIARSICLDLCNAAVVAGGGLISSFMGFTTQAHGALE
jgi:hypothetical protein